MLLLSFVSPAEAVKDAEKVKKQYLSAMSNAQALISAIKGDANWKWAKNPENLGELESLMDSLRGAVPPTGRRFLTEGSAVLKKDVAKGQFSHEGLVSGLEAFSSDVDAVPLAEFVEKLRKRHVA